MISLRGRTRALLSTARSSNILRAWSTRKARQSQHDVRRSTHLQASRGGATKACLSRAAQGPRAPALHRAARGVGEKYARACTAGRACAQRERARWSTRG